MPVIRVNQAAMRRLAIDDANPPKYDGKHFTLNVPTDLFISLSRYAKTDESYSDAILRAIKEHETQCSPRGHKRSSDSLN